MRMEGGGSFRRVINHIADSYARVELNVSYPSLKISELLCNVFA